MFPTVLFVVLIHLCTGRHLESDLPLNEGHRPHVDPHGRIIDGEDVKKADVAPYVAYVTTILNGDLSICTGTLIRKKFVLTAAHCIRSPYKVDTVTLGMYNQNLTTQAQYFSAANTSIHPSYPGTGAEDDIGIIKLNKRAVITAGVVETIKLAPGTTYPSRQHLYDNQNVTLFGWGLTAHKTQQVLPEILQTLEARVAPYSDCSASRNAKPKALCVARKNSKPGVACVGDSGGPLVANGTLIGVVSKKTATYCEDSDYSIYARVDYHQDWIKQTITDMK